MVSSNAVFVAFVQRSGFCLVLSQKCNQWSCRILHLQNALEEEHFAPKSTLCNIENKLQSYREKERMQENCKWYHCRVRT